MDEFIGGRRRLLGDGAIACGTGLSLRCKLFI